MGNLEELLGIEYDVVVVGAGVAGSALAAVLGRDGRKVLVIERDLSEQHRIVGELLQPGGVQQLEKLGLMDAVEGIDAQHVYGYGLFLQTRNPLCIDYSKEVQDSTVDSSAGISGRSFHNGRFVQRLRTIADAEENVTMIQGNVLGLVKDSKAERVSGVRFRVENGSEHEARGKLTIACDGCASRLRKEVAPASAYDVSSHFVGLILETVDLPFPNHGHVILCDRAPVLFYPISSTEVRCLVDVPASAGISSSREYLEQQILPQLPKELKEPFAKALTSDRLKSMPNRVMPAMPGNQPGAILLGDSFNMRHPLTGGGMTVALSDIVLVREMLKSVERLDDTVKISAGLEKFYESRKARSSTINILANALYAVFCATDDASLQEMREACYDYLGMGGRCSNDPMCMLGGLSASPILLLVHFFAVAVYGCGRVLLPFPTPGKLWNSWSLFRAAFNIVKPLIDAERVTPLSWIPFSRIAI
uniref:Squalene monooxygenase n=1 Tax=Timspurckia oligopyrenoides TaxID=708627 RepID=A0A6T6M4F5_9RHOD|mmetsp:Transcript_10793/g.19513  ORF Transcript_10793/g.19513 Transcript_10793/m.19513 type:complete len:477 (+) Transcript_10793:1435-2865(+)